MTGAAALLAGAAFAAGYKTFPARHPIVGHQELRSQAIFSQARQMGHVDTLVVGDSLVEMADLDGLCDGRTLNAGVGGGGVGGAVDAMPELLRLTTPKRVIIAIGVNNAKRGSLESAPAFKADYETLVAEGLNSGAAVAVATIGPVPTAGDFGAAYFDPQHIRELGKVVREVGAERKVRVLDVYSALAGADGSLPADLSFQGPHLTAGGYRLWKAEISKACG